MLGLTASRETKAAVEAEGIYIGGYSIRRALWPKTVDGKHGNYVLMHAGEDSCVC